MKIDKADVMLMVACALGGIVFMNFVAVGSIWASIIGINSGVGGGCLVCIFRRLLKRHHEKQQNNGVEPTR